MSALAEVVDVIEVNRVELILERLANEGFRPEKVSDESIKIRCEGRTMWVEITSVDETFFQVVGANIWTLESADEVRNAFEACSQVSDSLKVVKAYVTSERKNVWVEGSGFYKSTDEFMEMMVRIIEIVRIGITRFAEKMRELHRAAEIAKLH